jgi:hypothetical protein
MVLGEPVGDTQRPFAPTSAPAGLTILSCELHRRGVVVQFVQSYGESLAHGHYLARISTIDLVCAGTLLKRWKLCGRPNCRCAKDPEARHGPYYEWSRRQDGRFLHSLLSPQQAEIVTQAIADHQRILDLLATWREETRRILNIPNKPN